MQGKFIGRTELALKAIDLEQNIIKENVGFQDQCASAFGGLVLIDANKNSISPRPFITRKDYQDYFCECILMGFDGVQRYSGVAAQKTISKIQNRDLILQDLAELTELGIKAFSSESSIEDIAKVTKQIRDIKIQLNGDNVNHQAMDIIKTTEQNGSLCTRFMGAGGGGFFVCYAPPYLHQKIKSSVNIKTWVQVSFSLTGAQVIHFD